MKKIIDEAIGRQSSGYNAPLVYKTFAIVEEIARAQGEVGISDLARDLGYPKSTVYGITQALMDLRVLVQDSRTKKFRLGPALLRLNSYAMVERDLRAVLRPVMTSLAHSFGETVFLGTFDEQKITIIDKVDSPAELKITAPVGMVIPLFAGAAGKVFLAALPDEQLASILAEKRLPLFTSNSITDPARYLAEIHTVRKDGFATDFEEYISGVNAICVAIPHVPGWPVAAVWMVGLSHSFTAEKMRQAAVAALQAVGGIGEWSAP